MCDTLCVLSEYGGGHTLFAKNSDRSPNEPHIIIKHDAADYAPKSTVKCTYIEIEQVPHTHAVLLFKPSWIWGAEMGLNEHGVAIGNEAVFTKGSKSHNGLLGMDLLRLALERAESAKEAAEVIISLLEQYGQGGNCGFDHDFFYDNSFLACDSNEAYILETSGKSWDLKRIDGAGSISNRLASDSFAKGRNEPVYTYFSASKQRLASGKCALADMKGHADIRAMMAALRTHHTKDEHSHLRGSVRSVCMHAGGIVGDHTTGSVVIELGETPAIWATGASTPCISAFKPLFFDVISPPVFTPAEERHAVQYWMERERVHRAVLAGGIDVSALRSRRDALEARWLSEKVDYASPEARLGFCERCSREEQELIRSLDVSGWNGSQRPYWRKKNRMLEQVLE